jgi:membrane protease YdiL (CAAX protease family)
MVQILLISRILKKAGLTWKFVNYGLNTKQTLFFIAGYLAVGFGIIAFIEISLANMQVNATMLASISALIPKTTTARILFVIMGLTAGISEEIIYRGFAIRALENHRVNKWLAVALAAIPFVFQHGLKSIDQFWWFLIWGLVFGVILLLARRLFITIIIHWLVILSALFGVFRVAQ